MQASSNDDVFIPYVEIDLDPHMCMCQSFEAIIANIDSPIETNCSINPACTGVKCTIMIPPPYGSHDLEVDSEVCQNPPGAFVVVRNPDGEAIFAEYFNVSRVSSIPLGPNFTIPLIVNTTHLDYSVILEVCVHQSLLTIGSQHTFDV